MSRTTRKTDVFYNTFTQALLLKGLQVQITPYANGQNFTVRDLAQGLEVGMSYDFDTINRSEREPAMMAITEAAFAEGSIANAASQRNLAAAEAEVQPNFSKAKKAVAKKKPAAKKKSAPVKKAAPAKKLVAKKAAAKKKPAAKKPEAPANDTSPSVQRKLVKTADNVLS